MTAVGAAIVGSFFAAGDAAVTSLPDARIKTMAAGGGPAAEGFRRYDRDRVRVLSRWLVARIVLITASAALFENAMRSVAPPGFGPAAAVLLVVAIYGPLAETMGLVARRRPEPMAAFALRVLWPIEYAVMPLAEPIAFLGRLLDRRLGSNTTLDARLTETEVERAISEGQRAGSIAKEPAEMIRNVLDFKDLTTREVMVPRRRIIAVEIGTDLAKVLELVASEKHSRYPVFRDTIDNVVGLLYAKDLFSALREGGLDGKSLADLVRRPALFVAETQPAESVLREMRAKRLHLAIVSDEFGGTAGVVTLEDIIEEIVGEIRDEDDTEEVAPIQDLGDGRLVADAAIPLADLAERLGRELPADGEFESLGGLLVHRAGRVPSVGSTLTLEGYTLIVREADETRVVKVEIVPIASEEAALPVAAAS